MSGQRGCLYYFAYIINIFYTKKNIILDKYYTYFKIKISLIYKFLTQFYIILKYIMAKNILF